MFSSSTSSSTRHHQTSGLERRQFARHICAPERFAIMTPENTGASWVVKVRNISVGGVSVFSHHRVELGTTVSIRLRVSGAGHGWRLSARVAYVVCLPWGDFLVGCAFGNTI